MRRRGEAAGSRVSFLKLFRLEHPPFIGFVANVNPKGDEMKKATIVLIIAFFFLGLDAAVGAQQPQPHASVSMEKFDPPAKLDDYNAIIGIVTVTKIPGAPNLVLHMLCIRSQQSPKNTLSWGGLIVGPGVVEGCGLVAIPSGPLAGKLVHEDGEILPGPPRE